MSMVIILPDDRDGIFSMTSKVEKFRLDEIELKNIVDVEVRLPK